MCRGSDDDSRWYTFVEKLIGYEPMEPFTLSSQALIRIAHMRIVNEGHLSYLENQRLYFLIAGANLLKHTDALVLLKGTDNEACLPPLH